MHYCVYQDRCHKEVEDKMREFLLIPEAKEELLLFLISEKYLDEERFTRSYIRGKFHLKNWGKLKIKQHLKHKGISEKLILRCWDEIDSEAYRKELQRQYQNYFAKTKGLKEYQRHQKTIRYLLTKGYEYEFIVNTLNEENSEM